MSNRAASSPIVELLMGANFTGSRSLPLRRRGLLVDTVAVVARISRYEAPGRELDLPRAVNPMASAPRNPRRLGRATIVSIG